MPPRLHDAAPRPDADRHVLIVGLGNIGSLLVTLIARLSRVARLTLVDFDSYGPENLRSQDISRRDVGRAKARVQRRRVAGIDPRIDVRAVVGRCEDAALAWPPPDAVVGAVDSRAARVALNDLAWRCGGVPLIDSGVLAGDDLARVTTIVPADDAACLLCAWSPEDWTAVEQRHSCSGDDAPAATGAEAYLGAQAAALAAAECARVLDGVAVQPREVVMATRWDRYVVTALRRSPRCRFDHRRLELEPLAATAAALSFADALCLAGDAAPARLRVLGHMFVRTLRCPGCGAERRVLRLRERLRPRDTRCAVCGATMTCSGFDCAEWLDGAALGDGARRTLHSAGIAAGDVVTIERLDREHHFVLGAAAAEPREGRR